MSRGSAFAAYSLRPPVKALFLCGRRGDILGCITVLHIGRLGNALTCAERSKQTEIHWHMIATMACALSLRHLVRAFKSLDPAPIMLKLRTLTLIDHRSKRIVTEKHRYSLRYFGVGRLSDPNLISRIKELHNVSC